MTLTNQQEEIVTNTENRVIQMSDTNKIFICDCEGAIILSLQEGLAFAHQGEITISAQKYMIHSW